MSKQKGSQIQAGNVPGEVVNPPAKKVGCLRRLRNYAIAIVLFFVAVAILTPNRSPARIPATGVPTVENQASSNTLSTPEQASATPVPVTVVPLIIPTNTDVPQPTAIPTNTDVPPTATVAQVVVPTAAPVNVVPVASQNNVTSINPVTYYAGANGANLRTCTATTDSCAKVASIAAGGTVTVNGTLQGDAVSGSTLWYRVAYGSQELYVHSSVVTTSAPVAQSQPVVSVPVNSSTSNTSSGPAGVASGFVCPSNCDDARAMGLSAEQAATCPGLDRNHNGVACYGS